jgi:DNA polymerase III subunit epsilon
MSPAAAASIDFAVRDCEPARVEPVPRIPESFVVFDLETTGLDPDGDEIIEIGAIRVDRRANTREPFRVLVRSERELPRYITGLTGITADMLVRDGIHLDDALAQFLAFAGELPLVSYAAGFDTAFLCNAMQRRNPDWTMRNPVSCALKLSRLAWPYLPSFRLTDVADNGAHYAEPPHRALGDCERALLVYLAAVRELEMNAA